MFRSKIISARKETRTVPLMLFTVSLWVRLFFWRFEMLWLKVQPNGWFRRFLPSCPSLEAS